MSYRKVECMAPRLLKPVNLVWFVSHLFQDALRLVKSSGAGQDLLHRRQVRKRTPLYRCSSRHQAQAGILQDLFCDEALRVSGSRRGLGHNIMGSEPARIVLFKLGKLILQKDIFVAIHPPH